MDIRQKTREMKLVATEMASAPVETRNRALKRAVELLRENRAEVFEANRKDMAAAEEAGLSDAVRKRLKFDEAKLADVCAGIDRLIELDDPIGIVELERELDEGLVLKRISVPIGVLGVIFEARPDALVQIASLCIKSGNCAVLKGGSETRRTNEALFALMKQAAEEGGLPEGVLLQADTHSEIDALLECDDAVDLIIPRGSNAFVRYIMDHTSIPVMGHADGICHIYVDKAADPDKVIPVVLDAKLQYTAACNATETLLVDRQYPADEREKLIRALKEAHIGIHSEEPGYAPLGEDGYAHEYLEPVLSLRLVDGVREAVAHINRYGSHHTDAILTEDEKAADYFLAMVDSAGVYHNASTRFSDGFRYGFGAEVGISTGKLHARGPVGLFGLCTYKYVLSGKGHIVGDYADGTRQFHFRDLR
ncbi:MAG: glutamate-5-semialdehyde dehydrogenase [Lachnospiraceae bacterium]|nr:glutamate-5-semialdehyde dehydrogenase [Lachnospiraceae bacterium]